MCAKSESKQRGNCYQAAYECAQAYARAQQSGAEPALASAKIFLIHGSVITRAESLAGKRIDHAWIEIEWPGSCVVFEFADGRQQTKEKGEWVRELRAREEKRYTPEQASEEADRVSPPHYGPWHREPRQPAAEARTEGEVGGGGEQVSGPNG